MKLFQSLMLAAAAATALLAQSVTVEDAYVREVPPNMPNSAAFMTLSNASDAPVSLVSASSDVTGTVELHEHALVDGMMQMRQIPEIVIPAGGSAVLKPGGLHVMLIGLERKLASGETVHLNLTFSNGESVALDAPVKKVAAGMKMGGGKGMGKCGGGKCGGGMAKPMRKCGQ